MIIEMILDKIFKYSSYNFLDIFQSVSQNIMKIRKSTYLYVFNCYIYMYIYWRYLI